MSAESLVSNTSDSEQAAASSLGLPLRFEGVLDQEEEDDLIFISYGMSRPRALAQYHEDKAGPYWNLLVPCYLGLGLGLYGCLAAEMVLSATMLLMVLVFLGRQHRAICKNIYAHQFLPVNAQKLEFVIINSGLIEEDRGVASKCEWSSMDHWVLGTSVLAIRLSNGKAAVIPRKGLAQKGVKLEDICSLLKIKGVNGRKLLRPA